MSIFSSLHGGGRDRGGRRADLDPLDACRRSSAPRPNRSITMRRMYRSESSPRRPDRAGSCWSCEPVKKSQARRSSFCCGVAGERVVRGSPAPSCAVRSVQPRGGEPPSGARTSRPGLDGDVLLQRIGREELPVLLELGVDVVVDRSPVLLAQRVGRRDVQEDHGQVEGGAQPTVRRRSATAITIRRGTARSPVRRTGGRPTSRCRRCIGTALSRGSAVGSAHPSGPPRELPANGTQPGPGRSTPTRLSTGLTPYGPAPTIE